MILKQSWEVILLYVLEGRALFLITDFQHERDTFQVKWDNWSLKAESIYSNIHVFLRTVLGNQYE